MRLLLLATFVLSSWVSAQALYPVGMRDVLMTNRGAGSALLAARVVYPATVQGFNTPLRSSKTPYPCVVFLAGTSATGRDYVEVGYELASHGFIAVMSDSPINQFALQVLDGIALHAALVDENENRSSFLYQQLQTQRIALMGHSRGGAHVAHVLAQNPGYVCGVAYAPYRGPQLEYTKAYAPLVDVPMLVLGGRGDQISTAEDHVRGFFHELSGIRELKTLHIFDSNCTHYNIAAYLTWQQQMDKEIFDAVHRGVRAWLRAWIEEEPLFLDGVVGDSARGEGHISELSSTSERPQAWIKGPTRIGRDVDFQLCSELGFGIWWFSNSQLPSPLPTPWGGLELHPALLMQLFAAPTTATGFTNVTIPLPNAPWLNRFVLQLQVLAPGRDGYRLSNAFELAPTN
jgi:dienelactone hydrolase